MNRANRPRLSRISGSSYASKLLGRAGDGSTLTLDFTTGVLDSRLTFTRASTGTFINASGSVATASNNVARFDHDPTTLAPRGLLIEGTATNLINWSETFDTTGGATNWNWSALNVTRGTVTTTNPTGASATVIKIEETTANGVHAPLTVPTVLASTTYTFSIWAKAVERTFVQLFENGGSGANSMVNLSTGAIVSESTAGITTVTAFGTTGWYRISMRLTTTVGQTTANCQLRLSTNGTTTSYAGTTGSGIYIWGAQLEAGSGASSYIPTGASTVQRLADFAVINDISALAYSTTNGTLFYAGRFTKINSASFPTRVGFQSAGGATPAFEFFTSGTNAYTAARSASANPEVLTSISLNTDLKWAAAFDAALATGEVRASLNGASVITSSASSLTNTYTPTIFAIGRAGFELFFPFGTIRQVKYWPATLPDSQLQALST